MHSWLGESWLGETDPDEGETLDGYSLYQCDRDYSSTLKTKDGGVCTYVNDS